MSKSHVSFTEIDRGMGWEKLKNMSIILFKNHGNYIKYSLLLKTEREITKSSPT